MTKTLLLLLTTMISIGCVNTYAIESKYYSNCKEYYDFQGFYHNECKENKAKIYYNNINTNSDFINKTIYELLENKLEPEKPKKTK